MSAALAYWSDDVSPDDQAKLVEEYLPLVGFVARRMHAKLPASVDRDDLYQEGILGLIDAAAKWDPSRAIKFKTYAKFRVRGAMLDWLRSIDWVPRSIRMKDSRVERATRDLKGRLRRPPTLEEVANALGMTTDELEAIRTETAARMIAIPVARGEDGEIEIDAADESLRDPGELLDGAIDAAKVQRALESLPPIERAVLRFYFEADFSLGAIGELLGVTESRASQIHTKALCRLERELSR